jgi:SpoVK/Ycf46/Vps4 family AAA+-type ATPase
MDKNNNSMNGSNNKSNPVVINHYHYNGNQNNRNKNNRNKNNHRNRNNNRGRYNNSVKLEIPTDIKPNITIQNDNQNFAPSPKKSQNSHIIVRSTTDPTNMRIIPFTQNISPYMLHSNILKSLFEKNSDIPADKSNETPNSKEEIPNLKDEEFVELTGITNLNDLIKLGEEYDINDTRKYSIDMKKLKNIVEPLKELNNVIGMNSVKNNIFEQLIFILQELNDSNMMHTVIEGPPGVGKTLLGKILAKIYYKLDFLKKPEKNAEEEEINNIANHLLAVLNPNLQPKKEKTNTDEFKFKVVRRSDLIGQYVGSTAIKTQKVIDEAIGGVLFIDEVYSLGSGSTNDKGDSFAKEAIDTLNQNLSENGDKFICIIAGYPAEIERCFFSQNEGLKRRFPFKYTIEKYDSKELSEIFSFKVKEIKWNLDENLKLSDIERFIEKNKKSFEHFGGDIETLLLNIKIKHSIRIFGKNPKLKKLITMEDIKLAFEEYLKTRKEKELPQFVKDMYI